MKSAKLLSIAFSLLVFASCGTTTPSEQNTVSPQKTLNENINTIVPAITNINSSAPVVGGDKDAHGCIGSAGYSWDTKQQKCTRSWEENSNNNEPTTGGDKDAHGCLTSAGYSWDATQNKCVRTWENTNTNEPVVGGDKDEHGCIGSAGYSWCEAKKKCVRSWEEPCSAASSNTNTK